MLILSAKQYVLPFIVLCILSVAIDFFMLSRLESLGAFSTVETQKLFAYTEKTYNSLPGELRLASSYKDWALGLTGCDGFNYIRAGLSVAANRGLSIQDITVQNPENKKLIPYYFQGPGTPLIIGAVIKLFGDQNISAYFILVSALHFFSALITCWLASFFINDSRYVFLAGLLSLLCAPALDTNLGAGLFWSEPLVLPCLGLALIVLTKFWRDSRRLAYVFCACLGSSYGVFLGLATYLRDMYTGFTYFSICVLILSTLIRKTHIRQAILFSLTSLVVLMTIQYPWQKHNYFYYRQFAMSGTSYCASGLWRLVWSSSTGSNAGYTAGIGLGAYLAPEKSVPVLIALSEDSRKGSKLAQSCFIDALIKHPLKAIMFKLQNYDVFWFGENSCHLVYAWSCLSALFFVTCLFLRPFKIWSLTVLPLFFVLLSILLHYEPRYTQPFYVFITPVASALCLQAFTNMIIAKKQKRLTEVISASGSLSDELLT
jgi:hypothetical protein